jgi:hypothetical protein
MATPVINQLFEEGITRSQELSDAADEAMRAIDGMEKEAEELAQRVDAEAAEARQHIRELVSRLERSEVALEAAGNEARGSLAGLAGKSAELAAEAAELLDRVKASLAELDTRREAVDADLAARMSDAQDDAAELAGRTQAAQTAAEDGLQHVAEALAGFRTAIDAARTELGQKQQAWAAAAADLESQAAARAEAWTTALSDLLERQSTALVEAANSMVGEHNESMNGLRTRFAEQAPEHLAEALSPLEAALGEMGQEAQTLEQTLAGEADRMTQWADTAVPLVDALRTALDAAARME